MSNGIIVFGLNGSGKSTIGKILAKKLNYKHIDVENYWFKESKIPYTEQRNKSECMNLILHDINNYNNFVLSTVKGNLTEEIISKFVFGVYLKAPKDIRIKRIEQREKARHNRRIEENGDMHKQHIEFINFVKSRDEQEVTDWMETLNFPVITVDTTVDTAITIDKIFNKYSFSC